MTYQKLRNRINVLACFNVLLAVLVIWLLLKPNPSQEREYVPSRVDSLYHKHLERCGFISKEIITWDESGFPKFKNWQYIKEAKHENENH